MRARSITAVTAVALVAAGLLVAVALGATGGGAGQGQLVEVAIAAEADQPHTAPSIWDLAADPEGGTVAAVNDPSLGQELFAAARFRPDGTLDRAFGREGFTRLLDLPGRHQAQAVAVQPDGEIVLVGKTHRQGGGAHPLLARFRADGSLDRSFGESGIVTSRRETGQPLESESPQAVAIAPDGRIIVVGATAERGVGVSGRHPSGVVTAYEPDGRIDASFGEAGLVHYFGKHEPPGNQYTGLKAIEAMPDGRILVAGFRQDQLFLARLTSDGRPDPTFGGGAGEVTVDIGEPGGCYAVCWAETPLALLPDGRIVIVASSVSDRPKIVRRLPDGGLDPSFGKGGVVETTAGTEFLAFDMALQGGRIVVSGWEGIESKRIALAYAVLRYLPSGRIDRGFGRDGVDSRKRGPNSAAFAALGEPDGRVLVGGGLSFPGHVHRLALVDYPPVRSRPR